MLKGNLTPLLYVKDVRRSVEFYCGVLGFEHVGWWDEERGEYVREWTSSASPDFVELGAGNLRLQLHAEAEEEASSGRMGGVVLHLEVENADQYHERVQEFGSRSERPKDQPWGWRQFFVTDPDGHRWAFHHVIAERR
jgi:uncharacterized glyoxalase superfamily protein PhnB